MINIPLEKKPSEWRARVADPSKCKKDSYYQSWPSKDDGEANYPYNSKGIRALGCRKKSDNKSVIQSIRFSTKKKFKWTAKKIRTWIKDNGYSIKGLFKVYELDNIPLRKETEYTIYIPSAKAFKIKSSDDDRWIIRGCISSDQIDKHNEIVDPAAVMRSKDEYMEFATVRYMHQAEPIGNCLKLWRRKNEVWAEVEIHDDEYKYWHKIEKGYLRAFSIGFRVFAIEEYCPNGEDKECYLKFTEISLIEISVVDSPANTDAIFEVKKQLKEIGGDILVNKIIMKVDTTEDPTLADEEYVEWEEEEEGENMKDKNVEKPTEKETEEEEETVEGKTSESEPETQPEKESEEKETEAEDEGKEDEMKEEEKDLEFIDAEKPEEKEEDPEVSKVADEIKTLKGEVSGIKESVAKIVEMIESMKEEKGKKQKDLEKENKELKEKVEEKKLPKRQSFKDKENVYSDGDNKEEKLDEARDVGKRQLKALASGM